MSMTGEFSHFVPLERKEFADLLEKYGSNGSTGSTRNSPIQQGKKGCALSCLYNVACAQLINDLMLMKSLHVRENCCEHWTDHNTAKKACVLFKVLSPKAKWTQSSFKNGLGQVQLSVTQLPTSVSLVKETAGWYRFAKTVLCFLRSRWRSEVWVLISWHQNAASPYICTLGMISQTDPVNWRVILCSSCHNTYQWSILCHLVSFTQVA